MVVPSGNINNGGYLIGSTFILLHLYLIKPRVTSLASVFYLSINIDPANLAIIPIKGQPATYFLARKARGHLDEI